MRIHTALLSSTLLAMLTSCAGAPAKGDVNMPFGAAPMGEFAARARPCPVLVMAPCTMHLCWHDTDGAEWDAEIDIVCETDDAHEQLAGACLAAHLGQATERCQQLATMAMMDSADEVQHWSEHMRSEIDDVLFPCETGDENGRPVGRVRGLNWKVLRKRRSGHTFDYQPMLRRN